MGGRPPLHAVSECPIARAGCGPANLARACGPEPSLQAIIEVQEDVLIERIQNDSIFGPLIRVLDRGPFEGTVRELYDRLVLPTRHPDKSLPQTAAHLSRHLRRLKPALEKAGVHVAFQAKTREGRTIRVWRTDQAGQRPAKPGPWPNY